MAIYTTKAVEEESKAQFMNRITPSEKAVFRSCGGQNTSKWMTVTPYEHALKFDDIQFRCSFLRRLHLPVNPLLETCRCNVETDEHGFHRSSCMRTGLVHHRHTELVNIWRRIFKEFGRPIPDRNRERPLAHTHLRRSADDLRRLDIISSGISGVYSGKPLFMDITCVAPVTGRGMPKPRAANENGAANTDKDNATRNVDYPDIHASPHATLLSLSVETFGRWGNDSIELIRQLARAKTNNLPDVLKHATQAAYHSRWWSLLSVGLQKYMSDSIMEWRGTDLRQMQENADVPDIFDVLDFNR